MGEQESSKQISNMIYNEKIFSSSAVTFAIFNIFIRHVINEKNPIFNAHTYILFL